MNQTLTPIAHIHTDFPTKFGLPRQSGLVAGVHGRIVFTPTFRVAEALRGLEGFSYIWLLWGFSATKSGEEGWSPTVRPPRLGGNKRIGVWATRSPFRPNRIGLSSVRITSIQLSTPDGPVIEVEGADMMDGTPIYDIKPYLPFTDAHPEARGGFAEEENLRQSPLTVNFPEVLQRILTPEQAETVSALLAADPRPHYHDNPARLYTLQYAGVEVKFSVADGVAMVRNVLPIH